MARWEVLALTSTTEPSVVYASAPEGTYRLLDEDEAWQAVSAEMVGFLATDDDPDIVYASRGGAVPPSHQDSDLFCQGCASADGTTG